jgi:hypothetical protein
MIGQQQVFHKVIVPLMSLRYLDLQTQSSLIFAALIPGNFSLSYLNAGPVWSIVLKKFFISWFAEESVKYWWALQAVSKVHSLFPATMTVGKPTTLILAAWVGTRTRVGPNIQYMLLYFCSKPLKLSELQKDMNAFCTTLGVMRANGR